LYGLSFLLVIPHLTTHAHTVQYSSAQLISYRPNVTLRQAKFLLESIVESRGSESELKDRAHELIEELHRISPPLIADVLPQLEGELRVDRSLSFTSVARIAL
jgi:hypothetical protein